VKLTSDLEAFQRALENIAAELGVSITRIDPNEAAEALATVVVVGEPKNGKSMLVNALVGRPGLSPVDFAVATATYIAIRHGTPAARVFPEGATEPEEIHLDDLPAWTSVEGLRTNPRASRIPRPVEVTITASLLERVVLVDTPGVGGFHGTHDRATLDALQGATALLFCADGSQPLSEPEVGFLEAATERIAHVTFALTKVDQHTSWREVLAENREKIGTRAPRFAEAPWFPVAAPLAEKSLKPTLPAEAARTLRERSGIDALAGHLMRNIGARARTLVAANAFKAMEATARYLNTIAEERVRVLNDPAGDTKSRLDSERAELGRLRSREDEWLTNLEVSLNTLRTRELHRLNQAIQSLGEETTVLAKDHRVPPERLTEGVNRTLTEESNGIATRIAAEIDMRIRELAGEAVETPAFQAALAAAERSKELVQLREARDLVAEGRLQPLQKMPLMMGGTSGVFITNMVLSPMLGAWALLPGVGLALAAGAAGLLFARRQSKITERQQWLQARLLEAKGDLQTVVDQRILTAKSLAAMAVREWIRTRDSELKASILALNEQLKRDDQARQQAAQAANQRVGDLTRLTRTSQDLVKKLSAEVQVAGAGGTKEEPSAEGSLASRE
jgi:hypothetical protein